MICTDLRRLVSRMSLSVPLSFVKATGFTRACFSLSFISLHLLPYIKRDLRSMPKAVDSMFLCIKPSAAKNLSRSWKLPVQSKRPSRFIDIVGTWKNPWPHFRLVSLTYGSLHSCWPGNFPPNIFAVMRSSCDLRWDLGWTWGWNKQSFLIGRRITKESNKPIMTGLPFCKQI